MWDAAADHVDDNEPAGLVVRVSAINAWNRITATTRQAAGAGDPASR